MQLANADEADAVQKQGDLITANLYRIPPGASSVEVRVCDLTLEHKRDSLFLFLSSAH